MGKLHELLAVNASKTGQAQKVLADLTATFGGKTHLFSEKLVVFQPNTEGAAAVTEEALTLNSTVARELEWAGKHIAELIDVGHAINIANTKANSDITTEDGIVAKCVPATTLLELEKHLAAFKSLIQVAPTLDPAKGYSPDPTKGEDVYKAREVVKTRTTKRTDWVVVVPPTKEHPAQIKEKSEDVPTGTIRQNEWSGMLTPSRKAEILENIEDLLRAVKAARSRANEVVVTQEKIGKLLVDFVLNS